MASVVKIEDIQRDLQAVRDDVSRRKPSPTATASAANGRSRLFGAIGPPGP